MFRFHSEMFLLDRMPDFSQDEVKNEIMLFNVDFAFATEYGGPLTKAFLKLLPKEFKESEHFVLDSRVHMLMKDFFFPAIPGFHHDSVERTRPGDNQPNYINPSHRASHIMALVNGDICPTEFALGDAEFPDVPVGQTYYKVWHPMVEEKIKSGELKSVMAPTNQLIMFDDRAWHQATIARQNGWRWFVRATIDPNRKPTNEIRRQVQVYLQNPMEGW